MTNDQRLVSPEYNLEIGTDAPNIRLIMKEIEDVQAGVVANYRERNHLAYLALHARWEGQDRDGRKHADPHNPEAEVFPWEGASDTRIRTVEQTVNDHVTLARFGYKQAKVDAQAVRPFAEGRGRQATQAGQLLKWQKANQLRGDFQREIPLALNWINIYGSALIAPTWWQCRRLEYAELTVPILADIILAQATAEGGQMTSLDALMQIQSALSDPAQFENLVTFIQSLSPIVTPRQARLAVESLQQLGYVTLFNTPADGPDGLPVPYTFRSQPRLLALRTGIDVLFRDLTGNIQEEPWVAWGEWVSETDLLDRRVTENYDPRFVKEALKHKGTGSDDVWQQQTLAERGWYGGYDAAGSRVNAYANMIPIFHFLYKAHYKSVPAVYWTIFSPAVTGRDLKNPLVARHGLHPYKHGLYPLVAMRRERGDRPIMSSESIPEKAYTWQREEKVQADGLADRTALVHRPPLVGPISRQGYITGSPLPGSYLGVTRPNEFSWMPLPQPDATPIAVLKAVAERVEKFFGIFGETIDPDLKNMRRAEVAGDRIEELVEVFEQIHYLNQQYFDDETAADIVGGLQMPFQVSAKEIQGRHSINIIFDPQMVNVDYVKMQIELIGMLMPFNQAGTANMSKLFKAGMELVNSDLAEEVVESDQIATDRELRDQDQMIANAMVGIESPLPQHANHEMRLKRLLEQTIHSQNPAMIKRLQENPDALQILQKQEEFYRNNIQQYQENPNIGRTLGGRAFSSQAPKMALPAGG